MGSEAKKKGRQSTRWRDDAQGTTPQQGSHVSLLCAQSVVLLQRGYRKQAETAQYHTAMSAAADTSESQRDPEPEPEESSRMQVASLL